MNSSSNKTGLFYKKKQEVFVIFVNENSNNQLIF